MKQLNDLAKEIHQIARSKGFWDSERNTGELLMLIVSEISEALESDRKNVYCKLNRTEKKRLELTEDLELFLYEFKSNVKDTFEDEIADAIIRILDLCAASGIDIEFHIKQKMKFNKTRERLHGKAY